MFVIRDLKIIEGAKGFFVAMPSRKLTDRCHNCGTKNHLRSRFCNQCGCRLDENLALRDADGRAKLHADIAHPINSMCREKIQGAVLASYAEELERSKMPGYVSRYDEYEADEFDLQYEGQPADPWRPATNLHCAAARFAATRNTLAATSRCARPPRFCSQGKRSPRGSSPTTTTIAASRPRSAVVSEPPILGQSSLLLLNGLRSSRRIIPSPQIDSPVHDTRPGPSRLHSMDRVVSCAGRRLAVGKSLTPIANGSSTSVRRQGRIKHRMIKA